MIIINTKLSRSIIIGLYVLSLATGIFGIYLVKLGNDVIFGSDNATTTVACLLLAKTHKFRYKAGSIGY